MTTKEVLFITNIIASALLDATGQFSISGVPINTDEVVVRQINYCGLAGTKFNFLVQSTLSNQNLACVSNISGFTSNPGTRIILKNPIPPTITFQLTAAFAPYNPITAAAGDQIAICMDFIKYR